MRPVSPRCRAHFVRENFWRDVGTKVMSALGQKQTCAVQKGMSALPPKADMRSARTHVRFVPIADIGPSLTL
jgi:hypothetical protein